MIPGLGRSTGEGTGYPHQYSWAFLVGQLVKNPPAVQENWFDTCVEKIPWRKERLPTPVFWPGEFHGPYSACSFRASLVAQLVKNLLLSASLSLSFSLFLPCCVAPRSMYLPRSMSNKTLFYFQSSLIVISKDVMQL